MVLKKQKGINSSLLKKLKKLKEISKISWEPEFRERYLNPQPEGPLPQPQMEIMIHLGCVNGTYVNDLVTTSLTFPISVLSQFITTLRDRPGTNYPSELERWRNIIPPQNNAVDVNFRNLLGSSVLLPDIINSSNDIPSSQNLFDSGIGLGYDITQSPGISYSNQTGRTTTTTPITLNQSRNPPFNAYDSPLGRQLLASQGLNCGPVPCSQYLQNLNSNFDPEINAAPDLFGFQTNTILSSQAQQNLSDNSTTEDRFLNLISGYQTPFQNNVYLTSNIDLFNTLYNEGYTSVPLSQEGLLWTLWPLTKTVNDQSGGKTGTYFNHFVFGTSVQSNYAIGQLAFFSNPNP